MSDYTSIHFWIHQLAGQEMASLGDSKIDCNHMALAACNLTQAVTLSPKGTPVEPMQRQINRIANAFAAVGITPLALYERLKQGLPLKENQFPHGRTVMIEFAPGVGELSPRASALAKPSEPEGAHFLAAVLEKATPELDGAIKHLGISIARLIEALLSAPDTLPKPVEASPKTVELPVLAKSTSRRTIVSITNSGWKKVSVEGWHFDIAQNEALALCLKPSESREGPWLSNFENPVAEGGGLNLEIHVDEPVEVKGGDSDTLIVASRASGLTYSVLVEAVPKSRPPISSCFKLMPIEAAVKPLRLRLVDEGDTSGRAKRLFSFLRGAGKAGKDMSVNDGDTISLPAGAVLRAIDNADIGIPITSVVGERNIGAVVSCDFDAKLWSYEGRGHPSLGVLIWAEIPAGKQFRLSKSSVVVVADASQRLSRQTPISLTDSVEKQTGPLPGR